MSGGTTRAGSLNREITIQYQTVSQDPVYGTEVPSWAALGGGRMAAEWIDTPPSRSEGVKQGLTVARNQSRCRIRWRNDVDSTMRVVLHGDGDVVYQIIGGPAMIGRKEWLEIVCEKYAN